MRSGIDHHVQVKLEYGCVENEIYEVLTKITVTKRQCARGSKRRDMQGAILQLLVRARSVRGT